MTRILVAMEREAEALGISCTVIGIGAEALPETDGDDVLVNVGYCGAVGIPVGTVVEPDEAASYETAEGRKLRTHFGCVHAPCFTSRHRSSSLHFPAASSFTWATASFMTAV